MTIIVIIIDIREKEHKYAKFFDLFRCIFVLVTIVAHQKKINKRKQTKNKNKFGYTCKNQLLSLW